MHKLFLLDAYALIYRSYYAFIKNPRINSKGLNTSAIMGFLNTLNEVLTKEKPTHIGVAFDPHGPTFRSEAFPEYKAQREETPEDIRKAVPNPEQHSVLHSKHRHNSWLSAKSAWGAYAFLHADGCEKERFPTCLRLEKDSE